MDDYLLNTEQEKILLPSRFDFSTLRHDISQQEADIILVHGLYALYDKELRLLSSMKIFVDSDSDTRLTRWIKRDVVDGKTSKLEDVINHYMGFARPEMTEFIFPTKEYADVVLPRGAEQSGVALICDGIHPLMKKHGQMAKLDDGLVLAPRISPVEERSHNLDVVGLAKVNFSSETFSSQKERFYELN